MGWFRPENRPVFCCGVTGSVAKQDSFRPFEVLEWKSPVAFVYTSRKGWRNVLEFRLKILFGRVLLFVLLI